MEERKKDKLEDNALDDFSIENIDNSLGIHKRILDPDDHTKRSKDDGIDFDKTYLTNVSNDLVKEVNKVLNGEDDDDDEEVIVEEELPKDKMLVLEEEQKEEPIVQIEEPEITIEEPETTDADFALDENITLEEQKPKSLFEIDEPEIEPVITRHRHIEEPVEVKEEVIPEPSEVEIIEEPVIPENEPTEVVEETPAPVEMITEEEKVEVPKLVFDEEPMVQEEPVVTEEVTQTEEVKEEPKEENYESLLDHKPETPHTEEPKSKPKFKYISFESRVIRYSLIFLVLFVIGFFLLYKSININGEEYINYTESSNLDYKVLLKDNSFYEEKYLGKGMLYVASLIDKIDIDFLYNFNIDEKVNLDFNYVISGKLSIMDAEGKKVYLTKDYELLPSKTFSLKNEQDHTIIENIVIDYDQYNKLANSFKSTYGLDTSSKLEIYLNVVKSSNSEKLVDVNVDNNMLIEIPLSERSVSISMDYKDINRQSKLVRKSSISIGNVLLALISFVFIAGAFYGLYNVVKLLGLLNPKKSKYDKYIDKIMRQYDRLIVKHFTCPELSNYNVTKIREFNELLDMRDNLKMPIMYYNVTDHEKSYFYIVNHRDLYLLVIKAVDLNK